MRITKNDKEIIEGSVIFLSDYSFEDAFVGLSEDNRAIYEYDRMINCLMDNEGITEEEAVDWVECNTIPSLEYLGPGAPIIMHSI